MPDGVRIAVTLHRPDTTELVPAVMRATRYWRLAPPEEVDAFVGAGLALVVVDVRGTGASFGTWLPGWRRQEIADLAEVVDWLVAQPWCNGNVGAYGVSYDANTALLLAAEGHPAVKTVVPRFFDFDPFTHISHPGGVLLQGFISGWSAMIGLLDAGDAEGLLAAAGDTTTTPADLLARMRVDDDADGSLLTEAFRSHAHNVDVGEYAAALVDRDESLDGPRQRRAELDVSPTFVWAWGSWFDAGTGAGLVELFAGSSVAQRATVLASNHGGSTPVQALPVPDGAGQQPTADQQAEDLLAHFTAVLVRGEAPARAGVLEYWVSGSEQWRETTCWPPEGTRRTRWWATDTAGLGEMPTSGVLEHLVNDSATTGADTNRWATQLGGSAVVYDDRREQDQRLLCWTSSPLAEATLVVGAPSVGVRLAVSTTDAALHAYLEAVTPDGSVHYLTEGELRLRHRSLATPAPGAAEPFHAHTADTARDLEPGVVEQVELSLLPLAVEVPAGHRLRLALAGADAGTFVRIPARGPVTWTVHCDGTWLELPISPR
jgi:putative CocE/NonD family hydrolase